MLTQYTPGSDYRQVTVGAETVNLDCLKEVIESLGEKLRSTAIALFCFPGDENDDARNKLTKLERKGLLVIEEILKGKLFVEMHQPGREDSSSAASSAASFHVIAKYNLILPPFFPFLGKNRVSLTLLFPLPPTFPPHLLSASIIQKFKSLLGFG